MISFCEINKTDQEHIMINSSLLEMISKYCGQNHLEIWIDKSHYQHYSFQPKKVRLRSKNVIRPRKSNKLNWIIKIIFEFVFITQIVITSRFDKVKLLFFASLSPPGIWYLSLLATIYPFKSKVIVTLHSELELAKVSEERNSIEKIYGYFLRKAFSKVNPKIKYLILSTSIEKKVIEYQFLVKSQIICIEHPYQFKSINSMEDRSSEFPIIFGHLGVAKLSKCSHLFFKLADTFKDYVIAGKAKFLITGQVFEELRPYFNPYVAFNENKNLISRELYESGVNDLTYAVFFYNDESYALTSSGAIMDAISYGKPILTLKVGTFSSLFESKNCKPGYMYENFEEMSNAIKVILDTPNLAYKNLVDCINGKRNIYSIESQFPRFKEQLDTFL